MFLPAVCDQCGTIFQQRAIKLQNVQHASFTNVSVGPCPKCGGMGHIPDGVYNVIGNVIEVVSAPAHSRTDLERIAEIFRQARERKESPEEVAAKVRRDVPSLSKIADLLPHDRAEMYAFVQVVLAAIALYIALKSGSPNITVNQVINQITVEAPAASPPKMTNPNADSRKNFKKEKRRSKKGERQAERTKHRR
jgi:hypothetical protein